MIPRRTDLAASRGELQVEKKYFWLEIDHHSGKL